MKRALALTVAALLALLGALTAVVLTTAPVHAASQGSGFGTWAPISRYGWHGSMVVDGVHTYCVVPGRPAPTGESSDHGIREDAAGLSAAQLTGINLLVTQYGQTDDPVQAASVGWAVKAIANWDATLGGFGYPGDSLAGAINWTFASLAPQHNTRVQELATSYYTEATNVSASPGSASASITLTTDAADPLQGTATVASDIGYARGTLSLQNALFTDTGLASRTEVEAGVAYAITAVPESPGSSFRVRAEVNLEGGFRAAVRYFTTPDGQDTAGPAGRLSASAVAEDELPRETTFAPAISTEVASRYVASGRFIDDVSFAAQKGIWSQRDGAFIVVAAEATVYRTMNEPEQSTTAPDDAEIVGTLQLSSSPEQGPRVAQRVESDWELPGPGFYTAVWTIRASEQDASASEALPSDYVWVEPFGEPGQIVMIPSVSTKAQEAVAVGGPMSDDILIADPIPRDGVDVVGGVYRAQPGTQPEDTCQPENLVWSNSESPIRAMAAGTLTITAPLVPDFGTYYWQEVISDAQGRIVHVGVCGVENEITTAPVPTVSTQAVASAVTGSLITDRAEVTGPVPLDGTTELTFDLYRGVDDGDDGTAAASCTAESLVATTAALPVTAAGSYDSPGVRAEKAGVYYWVETLWHTPREGDRTILATGVCGLDNETTRVTDAAATSGLAVTGADARAGASARSIGALGAGACAVGLGLLTLTRSRFVARAESG